MTLRPDDLSRFAIFLDVDGTILDIAPTPHAVDVPRNLARALSVVHERAGGALALVSGRPLADLDFIFAPLRLAAAGGHGAEIRSKADGESSEPRATMLDRSLKNDLLQIAERHAGVATEDKGFSLALHYRLAPDQGREVMKEVLRLTRTYPDDLYELLSGKAVVEVKTRGFNKGTAVRELMTFAPFAGRVPIFIGDDITDEAAFAVMPEFGGLAYSVGRRVEGTDGCFDTPGEVRRWLDELAGTAAVPS